MNLTAVLPDGLREALGQVIANERREWRRERELIEAQARETITELRARIVEFERDISQRVTERLAVLKDGIDGKDGRDGLDGKDGVAGMNGQDGAGGRDGIDGQNGKDGVDGTPGLSGADGKDGRDGIDGVAGRDGADGKDGERGPEGPAGKLPTVRAWEDRVYYEGEVSAHDGATYQALRDTGRSPPHEDWICIAAAGRNGLDGRSLEIMGTYKEDGEYRALNVVVLNGGSFVAKRDNPGPCPGDGWQLQASQGKQGKPGDRGGPGQKGDRGEPGLPVVSAEIDNDGLLRLKNGDGSVVDVDLYPVLSRIG